MENPQQEGMGIVFKKPQERRTEESEIARQLVLLLHHTMWRLIGSDVTALFRVQTWVRLIFYTY
jgi:hypothetical protein